MSEAQVFIYDITGREVVNEAVTESPYSVVESGVYIVVIRTKTDVFSGKVMVE